MDERRLGVEDAIEGIRLAEEHVKSEKFLKQNIQEIQETMKKQNLAIIGIEGEDSQIKGPDDIFNKHIEENFPNIKEMPMKV